MYKRRFKGHYFFPEHSQWGLYITIKDSIFLYLSHRKKGRTVCGISRECLLRMKVSWFSSSKWKLYSTCLYKTTTALSLCMLCFLSIEPHKYQLWAYIYQARDLLAMDESGMNGMTLLRPVSYAVVSRPCTQRPSTPIKTEISILESDSTLTFSAVSLRFVTAKKHSSSEHRAEKERK